MKRICFTQKDSYIYMADPYYQDHSCEHIEKGSFMHKNSNITWTWLSDVSSL